MFAGVTDNRWLGRQQSPIDQRARMLKRKILRPVEAAFIYCRIGVLTVACSTLVHWLGWQGNRFRDAHLRAFIPEA